MQILNNAHVEKLKSCLRSMAFIDAIASSLEASQAAGGLWRMFSHSWPSGGIHGWNAMKGWRECWADSLPPNAIAFGEDVFGNQLLQVSGREEVLLWGHEDATCYDLYVDAVELLLICIRDGIDWIGMYQDGSLDVGRSLLPVSSDMHAHWTAPLILGGAVRASNVSFMPREQHLIAHAQIWKQVRDLPPGTIVVAKG